jgi:hypothetical protein
MTATAVTTGASPEVILRGENDIAALHIEVAIARLLRRWRLTALLDEFVPGDFGIRGDPFEAGSTQAALFGKVAQKPAHGCGGESGLLAPARTFVRLARFKAAAVRLPAHGTMRRKHARG